jgi:hypothetical protein
LLRTITAQIIRRRHDLLPYVYDEYVKHGAIPSLKKVRELLEVMMQSSGTIYLILDGLDECEDGDQKKILAELANLAQIHSDSTSTVASLKILVCSRETKSISRKLTKAPKVSLTKQRDPVERDISTFIAHGLQELEDAYSGVIIAWLKDELLGKAEGRLATVYCPQSDQEQACFYGHNWFWKPYRIRSVKRTFEQQWPTCLLDCPACRLSTHLNVKC